MHDCVCEMIKFDNQRNSDDFCVFLPEYFSSSSLCPSKAAQEAGKQTQAAIGKVAEKATDTIKEFGQKLETK